MLEERYGAEVELVPGVGGVFEITVDGRLLYSKKQTGRFPTDEEIVALGGGGAGTP
jgi:selT/selW/selH-like putative selenoprotein